MRYPEARRPWRPSGVTVVLLAAALALVGNLATNLIQVTAPWWPYAVWGAVTLLVAGSAGVAYQRKRAENTDAAITAAEAAREAGPVPLGEDAVTVVGALPELAGAFQHRDIEHRIDDVTGPPGGTVILTQVLAGLGGVGKTQQAARLAHQARNERAVGLVVWVDASQPDSIITYYQQAARQIGIPTENTSAEDAARAFLTRLASTPVRWLIVLDNLTDPDHLTGWWPPTTPTGRTIVTTRCTDAVLSTHGRTLIPIDVYTEREAHDYLWDALTAKPELRDDIAGVARDLGYLPLALSHAAAFMLDRNLTCTTYRDRFARHCPLAEVMPHRALPDDGTRTVTATLALSIDAANHQLPTDLAESLLLLASVLDTTSPFAAYTTSNTLTWLTHPTADKDTDDTGSDETRRHENHSDPEPDQSAHRSPADDGDGEQTTNGVVSPEQVSDALHCLRRLSLLTLTTDTVTVHNLVQRITRDRNTTTIPHSANTAADALLSIWPDNDTTTGALLRRNTTTLTTHLPTTNPHNIRDRAAKSAGETGNLKAAITQTTTLLTDQLRVLGPEHPHTLRTRNNLARWRAEAGDIAGAMVEFEALLTEYLRVLGPEHPDTLATRNHLAHCRGLAGDLTGAVAESEALLTDRLRVLGPEHPDTLRTRNNLATWRGEAGDIAGAMVEFEALLTEYLRVLGPEHPDTLATRNNIAHCHGEAGNIAGAVVEFEALLAEYLRVLGPEHPHTLRTRNNLAAWRGEAGDIAGAVAEFEALLTDRLRLLGAEHPDTLATRNNLALQRGEAGDLTGAVAEFEALLTDQLRLLGPEHPETLRTRNNLATWRGEAGDIAGAVVEFEALLTDRLRLLGPEHPDTLATRNDLATWRGEAGDLACAVAEFEALLTNQLQVLGPEHPDTLATRNNLAHWHRRARSQDG